MNLITGFEYPNYFYGATALFLLIGFYWLRRRATQKRVSAIFLWGPTEVSPQSGLRFKISVLPLSFYLEAAALLLIVLAATAPFRMAEENYPVLALVLDNSFSMRSTTPGGTSPQRRGVEELKKRLSSQPGRRVLAILAGDEPRLLSDGKLLPDLEAVWTVDDSFSDIPGAIALARKRSPGCEILVISDHAPDFELSDDTGYFAEGRLLGNTALVNVRRYKDSILCEVLNASLSPKAIQVKLNPGGVSPTIELKPHERRKIVVQISADDIDREIEVVLQDTDDPLEFDNRLITLPEKRYPIQIGYAGNLPETAKSELDKVLADNPDFTLSTTPELLFGVPGLEVGAYHRFIWNLGMANRS
ncbi:MAG: VWA domain-containing protein, partial [Victivallales bacterium]|nr:VWA domain-containing protein [Victivallales bacterium]